MNTETGGKKSVPPHSSSPPIPPAHRLCLCVAYRKPLLSLVCLSLRHPFLFSCLPRSLLVHASVSSKRPSPGNPSLRNTRNTYSPHIDTGSGKKDKGKNECPQTATSLLLQTLWWASRPRYGRYHTFKNSTVGVGLFPSPTTSSLFSSCARAPKTQGVTYQFIICWDYGTVAVASHSVRSSDIGNTSLGTTQMLCMLTKIRGDTSHK